MKLNIPDKEWVLFKSVLQEGRDYVKSRHFKEIKESLNDHCTFNNIDALIWNPKLCPWIVKEEALPEDIFEFKGVRAKPCQCPGPDEGGGSCVYRSKFKRGLIICTHPSNKSPGPESEKGMISVYDDLPPMFESVLIYGYCDIYLLGKYQIYQARRFSHTTGEAEWFWLNTRDEKVAKVTHWMELPSEPNKPCEHGCIDIVTGAFIPYKSFGDKHCRDCGAKLEDGLRQDR